jgi:hypothetical protein
VILDQAEQKGTGRWTAQDALELGVPLTAITEAVFARSLSALGDQRKTASGQLAGPKPGEGAKVDRELIDDVRKALYASKVVAYAQGFEQMTGGRQVRELGARPGCDGDHLARRLHHPRALPRPHPRGLRHQPGHGQPAARRLLPRRGRRRAGLVAARDLALGRHRAARCRRSRHRSPTTTATGASAGRRR